MLSDVTVAHQLSSCCTVGLFYTLLGLFSVKETNMVFQINQTFEIIHGSHLDMSGSENDQINHLLNRVNQLSRTISASNFFTLDLGFFIGEPFEVEIIVLSPTQKELLKKSWAVIYSEIGQSLCYVSTSSGPVSGSKQDGVEPTIHRGVAETFFRLFEEYPQSLAFFGYLGTTSMEELRQDPKLSSALQEHAVRVLQVVEKVIGRIDNLEKSKNYLLNLGRFHHHAGVPNAYFGVMGTIFLHAVRPYLEKKDLWSEEIEDAWMALFGHIARVMAHGHTFYYQKEVSTEK